MRKKHLTFVEKKKRNYKLVCLKTGRVRGNVESDPNLVPKLNEEFKLKYNLRLERAH